MATANSSDQTFRYVEQARNWIEICDRLHGEVCVPNLISERPPEDIPRWLIDTHQQCVVPGVSADRYMALSYVWPETRGSPDPPDPSLAGSSPCKQHTLLLDNATISDFQTVGFLDNENVTQRIPMVIRHAMRLAHVLGLRYLWVDRLCIVQNDSGEGGTLSQVAKMDKIYAGAYLTYIGAASEEIYEKRLLSDWPSFTTSRYDDWDTPRAGDNSNLSNEQTTGAISAHYALLSNSNWGKRGWTYQEQILCNRALVILDEGFFWDCHYCVWDGIDLHPSEDLADGLLRADMGQHFSTRWWPDFGLYLDLICPYNGRNFTYPQDAILGISGILNALGNSFPGGFIFGLPRLFLDHALLWQPFGTADRRMDRTEDGTIHSSLPSWSWCGWQVFVDAESLRSGLSYIDDKACRAGSWTTRNLVEWRLCLPDETEESVIEPDILDNYVNTGYDIGHELPEGWLRCDIANSSSHSGGHPTGPLHTHVKHRDIYFKHPVPLKQAATNQTLPKVPFHMTCSTSTISFHAAAMLTCTGTDSWTIMAPPKVSVFGDKIFALGPAEGKACPILVLQQPHGAFGGLLRLMSEDDFDKDVPLELIAISTGSANRRDMRASLEWHIFAAREDKYRDGNYGQEFHYSPTWMSAKGKYALSFDIAMAFDKEAVRKHTRWISFCSRKWSTAQNRSLRNQPGSARKASEERKPEKEEDPEEAICEFYNVLWIEHKDGIAYRRACGRVPKYIWEAYATGPVDIKLG